MIITPIQTYKIKGINVLVKREDLASSDEKYAPPFSKVRGLIPHLSKLKDEGIDTIGYTETSISMAGWGVAWAARRLGMSAVIFDPQYIKSLPLLKYHRKQWKKFSPEIIPIKAGMAKVNYYIGRNILNKKYKNSVMLPLGLPLPESIEATRIELLMELVFGLDPKSIVVSIGSGTIASGLYKIIKKECTLYGIMTRTGSIKLKKKEILKKSGKLSGGLFGQNNLNIIDPGWNYTDGCDYECPFPCHAYYDRKAWKWLNENLIFLPQPILFWNIGH